jgi:hypothetical protein
VPLDGTGPLSLCPPLFSVAPVRVGAREKWNDEPKRLQSRNLGE